MVFKPDLGVNGVRWGQSVYALGVMLLEMFVKSKLNQSQIVPSQVSQTTRPIEEKKEGDSYFNLSQKMHLCGWKYSQSWVTACKWLLPSLMASCQLRQVGRGVISNRNLTGHFLKIYIIYLFIFVASDEQLLTWTEMSPPLS